LSVHGVIASSTWRRQRPLWITIGIFAPLGASVSVNVPSTAVVVVTSGDPDSGVLHVVH
jgi:hypothetical protein